MNAETETLLRSLKTQIELASYTGPFEGRVMVQALAKYCAEILSDSFAAIPETNEPAYQKAAVDSYEAEIALLKDSRAALVNQEQLTRAECNQLRSDLKEMQGFRDRLLADMGRFRDKLEENAIENARLQQMLNVRNDQVAQAHAPGTQLDPLFEHLRALKNLCQWALDFPPESFVHDPATCRLGDYLITFPKREKIDPSFFQLFESALNTVLLGTSQAYLTTPPPKMTPEIHPAIGQLWELKFPSDTKPRRFIIREVLPSIIEYGQALPAVLSSATISSNTDASSNPKSSASTSPTNEN